LRDCVELRLGFPNRDAVAPVESQDALAFGILLSDLLGERLALLGDASDLL
jgi:hypothetical protein